MKNILIIFFLFLCYNVVAQNNPSGVPTQFSTGWFRHGWDQSDSGKIFTSRAPNFTPRFPGTVEFYQDAGVDSLLHLWTGGRWLKLIPGFDSASLSNRINLKLNITDTTSKWWGIGKRWVDTVYRVNDSTIGFTINNGSEQTFQILGRSSGGGGGSGTVTSVALSMPSAFSVTGSPITSSGTFSVSGAGTTAQYIRGNGTLATTDTGMIPNFYLKVRGLLTGTSPITFNQFTGGIGINNADASGTKGAASFNSASFSANGAGLISLSQPVPPGACINCDITWGVDGRPTSYASGTHPQFVNAPGAGDTLSILDTLKRLNAGFGITHIVTSYNITHEVDTSEIATQYDLTQIASTPLNNIGAGFRWLATPSGDFKSVYNSNTILWDSISNANGLTPKADTSVLATQYDLTQIVSGINQLTGDVIAGPGSGSQVATISTNAVTDAKFRQSVSTSVVGRSANSTGNVADIQATIASTYLKRDATPELKFDSIDYAEIKHTPSTNPGVYFSPAQSFDPSFVVLASVIAYPTNSFSHGSPVTWGILDQTTGHNSSFIDSAYGNTSNQRLALRYPTVKNVLNHTITPDESFAAQSLTVGATVGFALSESAVSRGRSIGIRLTGNGAGTWTKSSGFGLGGAFDVTTYNTGDGGTSFNVAAASVWGVDYDGLNIQYIGPNNYHIKRVYSGLGAYNVRFILLDEFGNFVSTNPTTSDEIIISNAGMQNISVGMATWAAGNNDFMAESFNWWVFATFECWLVAAPVSISSVQVRWQPVYPSATNYKIYRATSLYGARTLVHTGTDGSFIDSGLGSGTLYWYFMIAVIGGIDTEITYFRTSTKAF